MLKHMKSLIINEIYSSPNLNQLVDMLYVESCNYICNRINSETGRSRFKETSSLVRDTIRNNFNYDNYTSFAFTIARLNREQTSIKSRYTFFSLFETLTLNPEKYDDMAFEIAFDILRKIKIRFYDGFTG